MTHRYTLAVFGFLFLLTAIFLPSHRASLDTDGKPTGAGGWTYGAAQTIGRGTTISMSDLMAREKKNPKPTAVREPIPERPAAIFLERKPNPDAPLTSTWPPTAIEKGKPLEKAGGAAPNAPQTPGLSFTGVQSSDLGGITAPSPQGAVGPTQVVVVANRFARSFNKTTGAPDGILALRMSTFFSPVGSGGSVINTGVKFDPISRRWFFSNYDEMSERVLFAVSSGENITDTSSFTFFSFALTDGGGAELQTPTGDFCTLGIDATGVYFGLNMFAQNVNYIGSTVFVVNKADLLAATPTLTLTAFRQLNAGQLTSPGASSPFVADNPDPAATEAYLIGVDHASFGLLVLRRITGAGTATPAISGDFNLTVPATANPLPVPVLGRSLSLNTVNDRLHGAKIRNGSLWTVHDIGVNASGVSASPDRTASRWYEIGTLSTTPTLIQSGTVFSNAAVNPDSFWVSSIGITGQGHLALGCNAAGRARFIDIVTAGRLSGDAPGTLRAPATLLTATNSYTNPISNWGEYSGFATDPDDDMTLWTFQQFAPTILIWGARAIQLRAPAPAAVASITPAAATQGQTLDITVNGVSNGETGFYNPSAPFPKRLAADFGPGVTVNSVTVNSPTQAVFNVTVGSGAATGTRDVTVTNPDGQSATRATLFTVNLAGCGGPITVDPTSLPNGVTAAAYNQTLTASGAAAPYSFSLLAGTLPPGLTLSSGGVLSGTPTTDGTFAFTVVGTDGSGLACAGTREYTVTVGTPTLERGAITVTTDNNLIEPNECNLLSVALSNTGTSDATGVSATLSTATPGVTVTTATSAYPDILAGGAARTNATAFQISTDNTVACGAAINFTLNVAYVGGPVSFNFTRTVGQTANPNYTFEPTTMGTIPGTPANGVLVTGTRTADAVAPVTLPGGFTSTVYGIPVTSLTVDTNGTLRVNGVGTSAPVNQALPSAGSAGQLPATTPVLMPYWDDLALGTTKIPSGAGGVYTQTVGMAPNRQFVIEWRARHNDDPNGDTPTINFAVVLTEGSDTVTYVYPLVGGVNPNGVSATVGAQEAATGARFSQFSFNTGSLTAGLQLTALGTAVGICSPGAGPCRVAVNCGTPSNINSLVSFTGGGSIAGPTCGPQGYSNDYVLNGTITNVGSQTLCSLSLQLVELSEAGGAPPAVPFRLVSADGATCTSGGLVGSVQTISSPATLAPGQSANVTIRVAMPTLRRFRLTFNVFGGIPPGGGSSAIPAGKSMMAKAFELSVEPFAFNRDTAGGSVTREERPVGRPAGSRASANSLRKPVFLVTSFQGGPSGPPFFMAVPGNAAPPDLSKKRTESRRDDAFSKILSFSFNSPVFFASHCALIHKPIEFIIPPPVFPACVPDLRRTSAFPKVPGRGEMPEFPLVRLTGTTTDTPARR